MLESFRAMNKRRRDSTWYERSRRKGDAATPGAVRTRLQQSGQAGDTFLLEEIKQATGAEQVDDLRSVTLNFYYPE